MTPTQRRVLLGLRILAVILLVPVAGVTLLDTCRVVYTAWTDLPFPALYYDVNDREVPFIIALFHSRERIGLVLMASIASLQLASLVGLWHRPKPLSVLLYFFGALSYLLVGLSILFLRAAYICWALYQRSEAYFTQMLNAFSIAALGAAASLCALAIGMLFYLLRWRHTLASSEDRTPDGSILESE